MVVSRTSSFNPKNLSRTARIRKPKSIWHSPKNSSIPLKIIAAIFEKGGIEIILRGAPSSGYKEDNWWAEEAGLLMVNNEYVKLFYYYIHY